jgi:hypothetical protein
MRTNKSGIEKLLSGFLLLSLLITPTGLFGQEAPRKTAEQPATKGDFALTVKDDLVSLKAKDVSFKRCFRRQSAGG